MAQWKMIFHSFTTWGDRMEICDRLGTRVGHKGIQVVAVAFIDVGPETSITN
jgi:hypothetical protein